MELPTQIAFKLREDNHISLANINRILRENKMGKLIFSVWICGEDGQNTLNKIAQFLNVTENFEPKIYEVINGGPNCGSWVKPMLAFEYFTFLPEEIKIQATKDLKTFLNEKEQSIELYTNKESSQNQKIKIIRNANIADTASIEESDIYHLVTSLKITEIKKLLSPDKAGHLREIMASNLRQVELVIRGGIDSGVFRRIDAKVVAIIFWNMFMGIIQFQENRLDVGKKDYRKSTLEAANELIMAGLKKK